MECRETLYRNADFLPMTAMDDAFEALLVAADGTIAYTGPLEEARRRGAGAREVDLEGACVMPGLIDAHSHFSGAAQYETAADLSGARSFADVVRLLRAFAAKRGIGADGVVVGANYDHTMLAEGRHPDRRVLDEVSTEVPVVALHASSHMCACNSRMLEVAGVTRATPDPEGGRYGREADGAPDGYCEEPAAMFAVLAQVQARQPTDICELAGPMQEVYLEQGITTCQDGAQTSATAATLCTLAEKGLLKLDIVGYPMHGEPVDDIFAAHGAYDGPRYRGHFRFGGLKMFLDGSPQGRTAWMVEPYEPGPEGAGYRGYPTMADDDVYAFSRKAVDAGRQLLAHANGDAAMDQLLEVYGRALHDSPNPGKNSLRPVAIHCQTARPDQYARMAALGMTPSIFASHIWYWGDVHLANFGRTRAGRISACGSAAANGLPFTLHCDTPVLRPNLLEAVWCAARRLTRGGAELDADQRVSVYEGLRAVTVHGALQYGELARKGTLEAGKLADLAVLDRNPLKVDLDDLRRIRVLATVKQGRAAWRRLDGPCFAEARG